MAADPFVLLEAIWAVRHQHAASKPTPGRFHSKLVAGVCVCVCAGGLPATSSQYGVNSLPSTSSSLAVAAESKADRWNCLLEVFADGHGAAQRRTAPPFCPSAIGA